MPRRRPQRSNLYAFGTNLRALLAEEAMFDLAMIALGSGFFAAAILYTAACNGL